MGLRNAIDIFGAAFGATIITLILTAGGGASHRHAAPKDHTDLAARINAACPKPDYVQDWTTGDEYTQVPKGTVKVTCVKASDQSLYYVAVAR